MKRVGLILLITMLVIYLPTASFKPATQAQSDEAWIAFNGFSEDEMLNLYVIHPDGTGLKQLTTMGDVNSVGWSTDGEWVLFSTFNIASAERNRYRIHPDGTNLDFLADEQGSSVADGKFNLLVEGDYRVSLYNTTTLIPTDGSDSIELGQTQSVSVSPDGQWLFFSQPIDSSNNESPTNSFIMNFSTQEITELELEIEDIVWLPDSTSFFFFAGGYSGRENSPNELYEYDLATQTTRYITKGNSPWFVLSPDQQWLTFIEDQTQGTYVKKVLTLVSTDGTDTRVPILTVVKNKTHLELTEIMEWSPDGEWIAIVVRDSYQGLLYLVRSDGSEFHPITDIQPSVFRSISWSPQ